MEEKQHSAGRAFAAAQILSGAMMPAALVDASIECVPQALERDEIDRAEFWVGAREQARLFQMQGISPAQRQAEADFEIIYLSLKTGEVEPSFCYREETAQLAKQLAEKAGDAFATLVVRPAYFEEVGALCMTPASPPAEARKDV